MQVSLRVLIGCSALTLGALRAAAQTPVPAIWRLEPIATLEGISPDDPYGVIRGIALHRDGRVVVTESNPRRVSLVNAQGRSVGMVGRIGSGPGEYREPYSSVWLADTLAIYDPGESRVLYLTQASTHLRTESTPRYTGPDIRFFPVSRTKAYLPMPDLEATRIGTVFVGFGGPGTRDTLSLPQQPQISSAVACGGKGSVRFFTAYQAPKSFAVPIRADGALAVGNTGQYQIAIQRRGALMATLTRKDFVPMPLTNATWRFANQEYQRHVDQFGAASCGKPPVKPAHVSPILATAVADNGDIWVTVRGKDEYAFNVFDSNGVMRGSLSVPRGALAHVPIAVAGDRIAYATEDRDGVQSVHLARIVK